MQNLVKIRNELRAQSFHNAIIETETGICTSIKSDLYFRSRLPRSTKSALLNFNSVYREFGADSLKNVVTRAQKSKNPNLHTSKIGYLLLVYGFRNTRRRIDHISEPHVKFGKIRNELQM